MVKDVCVVHVYTEKQWGRPQKHALYERPLKSKNKTNSEGL